MRRATLVDSSRADPSNSFEEETRSREREWERDRERRRRPVLEREPECVSPPRRPWNPRSPTRTKHRLYRHTLSLPGPYPRRMLTSRVYTSSFDPSHIPVSPLLEEATVGNSTRKLLPLCLIFSVVLLSPLKKGFFPAFPMGMDERILNGRRRCAGHYL